MFKFKSNQGHERTLTEGRMKNSLTPVYMLLVLTEEVKLLEKKCKTGLNLNVKLSVMLKGNRKFKFLFSFNHTKYI